MLERPSVNETLTMEYSNQYNQQPVNDCSLSRKKTTGNSVNHESKESNSETKRTMDFLGKETTSSICNKVTGHKDIKRTQHVKAVLEAYGIVPVKGNFSSFPRKMFDASPECGTTPPSDIKAIIAGFLG